MNETSITKAGDLVILRKLLRERGDGSEEKVLSRLTPETQNFFKTVVASAWIDQDEDNAILTAAAAVLYPNNPQGLRMLGKYFCLQSMTGVYKIFLRIPTTAFIIKQVASVWPMFYRKGRARVVDYQPKTATLEVGDFPDMSGPQREIVAGYLLGILELTGEKNVQVIPMANDSQAWKWRIAWE